MMEFDWLQFVTTASLVLITIVLLRNEKRHRRYIAFVAAQSRINNEQVKLNTVVTETTQAQRRFNHAAQEIFEKVLHVRVKTTLVDPEENGRYIN